MKNADLINSIKDIKKEMPFYDELYQMIDVPKVQHIITILVDNVPNTNKWQSYKLLNLNIVEYLLDVPILEVRKLLMLYNDGEFTLHYIEKKLKYEIMHHQDNNISNSEKPSTNAFKLLYLFEDFIITSYKRKFQNYLHYLETGKQHDKRTARRSSFNVVFESQQSSRSGNAPKLNIHEIDDWQESAEQILKTFTLYLNKLDLLYDVYPPVYSKLFTVDTSEISTQTEEFLDKEELIIRNGGLFRIIINILILLIDGQ
jgi:hypothetical protein